jgi:hypothetical protein
MSVPLGKDQQQQASNAAATAAAAAAAACTPGEHITPLPAHTRGGGGGRPMPGGWTGCVSAHRKLMLLDMMTNSGNVLD